MKKILICLLSAAVLLCGCSSNTAAKSTGESAVDNNSSQSTSEKVKETTKETAKESTKVSGGSVVKKDDSENKTVAADNNEDVNISDKVKDYIINGQNDLSESEKLKWSKSFLIKVNVSGLYDKYKNDGGEASDVRAFARYITENAPVLSDWDSLFKEDLYNTYGQSVTRLEHLEGDLYQAYVLEDGAEVPYVVVNARTGYFHG